MRLKGGKMTREQYLKHKDVMEWFYAEEGRTVLLGFDSFKGVRWSCTDTPQWSKDDIYIPNDKYVEFRKALVEGKIVEFQNVEMQWINLNESCMALEELGLVSLRIKPEPPEFKVGAWVRSKHEGIFKVSKVTDTWLYYNHNQARENTSYCELWTPQEDDVVVCMNGGELFQVAKIGFNIALSDLKSYHTIIPYIGQSFEDMK